MSKQADLLAYVCEGQPHLLSGALTEWMIASTRFTTFVETYCDKIRKKARLARESESALDLHSELEVAYALLTDRRLAVAYEPYANAKTRTPDFAVTYRDNLVFNVEVARIRIDQNGVDGLVVLRKEERIVRTLVDKLAQMQHGMANLLVLHTPTEIARSIDLNKLIQSVKTRAEAKEPSLYAASRYNRPAEFYKDFLHLSGIVLWTSAAQVWLNKQARPGLPEKVLQLVSSLSSFDNK